jgi:hypothetical protein
MSKTAENSHPRSTITVSSTFEKKLTAYVAAASAAGVGALALAQPAQAKVVYTFANVTIGRGTTLPLDLNHDGVNDFSFSHFAYGNWDHFYAVGLAANHIFGNGSASALRAGVPIGPQGRFSHFGIMAKTGAISGYDFSTGKWLNVQNRYLGLQFSINGKTHYGWARLTVTLTGGIVGTLTGYAYETVPNKRIVAGQTSGTDAAEVEGNTRRAAATGPLNLGMLARGTDALALWRRDNENLQTN